jgi:hypothetical protein
MHKQSLHMVWLVGALTVPASSLRQIAPTRTEPVPPVAARGAGASSAMATPKPLPPARAPIRPAAASKRRADPRRVGTFAEQRNLDLFEREAACPDGRGQGSYSARSLVCAARPYLAASIRSCRQSVLLSLLFASLKEATLFQAFAMYAVLALAATGFFFITIIGSY